MHKNTKIFIGLIGIFIFVALTQAALITEGFEGTTFPPTGWDTLNYNTSTLWNRRAPIGGAHGGSYSAWLREPTSGSNNNWLITPNIGTISTGDSVIFWLRQYNTAQDDTCYIRVCTTATRRDTTTYRALAVAAVSKLSWQRKAFSLSAYVGHTAYIAFVDKNGGGDTLILDDATFQINVLDTFQLVIARVGNGTGTVAKNPTSSTGYYTSGTWVRLTATPGTGSHFVGWSGDLTGSNNPDSVLMTVNRVVTATFTLDTLLLTVNTVGNGTGSVAKLPNQTYYNYGKWVRLTATPGTGSHFVGWSGDLTGSNNPDSVLINVAKTVTARFNQDTFTITASSGAYGSVTPTGVTNVPYGGSQLYDITPNVSYHTLRILVDGSPVSVAPTYTFTNVTANHTVSATFGIDSFTITASASPHGTISPSGTVYVLYNATQSFSIKPDEHCHILNVFVDGSPVGNETNYTFSNCTANHTIHATFATDSLSISASAGPNGTISPSGTIYITYGGNQSFTITPAEHYHILNVLVDGSSVGRVTSYDFTNVTTSRTIEASFQIDSVTITASAGTNGTVSPLGVIPVPYNGSQLFAITPSTGYHTLSILVDGGSVTLGPTYEFTNVTTTHTISATFGIDSFTITASSGANGSVTPTGPTTVTYNGSQLYNITPNTGYHTLSILVDGSPVALALTYLFTNVTDNHTISATYGIDSFNLTVSIVGNGNVTKTPDLAIYTYGTWLHLTGNPDLGWHFVNWTDSLTSTNNPDSILMNSDKVVTAHFAINTYTLTVNSSGSGTVDKNPNQSTYNHGTWVRLTAIAGTGWHFFEWRGDISGNNNPESIYMNSAKTVTASFQINNYSLTISIDGNGYVSKSPDLSSYNYGSWVHLTAIPQIGWHFVNWSDDLTGSNNPDSIYIDGVKTVIAHFAINSYALTISINGDGAVTKNPDQTTYNYGTWVKLTANPATGWHFLEWRGDISGSNNPDSVYIDGPKTVTANFGFNTYTLTIITNGNGIVQIFPNQTSYNYGTWVLLIAVPATGWNFVDWSGDLTGGNNPDSIYINGNKTVIANFAVNTYPLTTHVIGSGSIIRNPDQSSFAYGTWVHLTANPQTGWHFVNWSDSLTGSNNPDSIYINGPKVVTATFAINTYSLTVIVVGNGNVIKNPEQTTYNYGTWVRLTANADDGWHFVSWSGDLTGSNNPDSVLMNDNKTVTANFGINTCNLTINISGNGSVDKEPNQSSYNYGTWVQLTAIPNTGWHFTSWSGDLVSTNNPDSIYMNGNKTISANFSIYTYVLNITIIGNGNVIRIPNQPTYNYGTQIQLTAVPTRRWCFTGWSGDTTGNSNPISFFITADKNFTATFESVPYPTWQQRKNILTNILGKDVRDGGALVATSGTKDGGALYAFRGNKSNEFYKYTADTWVIKESIPYGIKQSNPTRINKKQVRQGGALCYDNVNNIIYATKGNNTKEFWAYYVDTVLTTTETLAGWRPKPFIPSDKALRNGSSLLYHNGLVYLLVGGLNRQYNDFFVYNPSDSTWTVKEKAPIGADGKSYKAGSCIVSDGIYIYALKGGAKINEFYRYNIEDNSWTLYPGDSLPRIHPIMGNKKTKVKDGAAMTMAYGNIYAIKGGGSPEFWKYTPGAIRPWMPIDTIPKGVRGKKGTPKTGASLTFLNDTIYLLKGNKTLELWRYGPIIADAQTARTPISVTNPSIMSENNTKTKCGLKISSNPFTKIVTLNYTVTISGKVLIKLYNTNGRLIETVNDGYHNTGTYTTRLSTDHLAKGIYFLKYSDMTNSSEIKLIVQ